MAACGSVICRWIVSSASPSKACRFVRLDLSSDSWRMREEGGEIKGGRQRHDIRGLVVITGYDKDITKLFSK